MSTADPTGDGGGGPISTTPTGDNVTPVTSSTGIAISPGSHHQQHPPPSPLSGCYLLVVLPEPHTAQHRDLILNRLAKGFLSWDKDGCHVDLEKELQALVTQAPEGEEARNGERLIQYATENLVTEVLIHPQTNTLQQCIRNLLASFTKHRHIIHAGYTFSGNGSWILQDGTFSLADFLDAFSEHEVQRVLRAYENSVTVDINCAEVGEWSTSRLSKEACTRSCRVRLNPDDVLTAGVPAITSFTNYVGQYLVSQTLDQLMEPSDVVGNIRFSHPTLYVFPGGQGDAALFGINGFNMLVDGGFARKACFWDFARHLDRLDAVLMTRINNSNVGGMSSVLRKKREMHVYPQIGHFFCNLIERRHLNSPDGDKDLDPLILNLTDIGHEMMVDLRHINLRAHPCYRDPNPINLYHKVGHGTLDMYVLNPSKDSREVREFLTKWHASDSKLFSGSYRKDSNNLTFPIQNIASICALLVWQPANPEDTITRILFPGSTPQHKIFEGIDRLKHLEFLKHPVCTAKSLSPSTSLLALKDRPTIKQKMNLIEETKKPTEGKKEKREFPDAKLSKATEDIGGKAASQPASIGQTPKTAQPAKIDVKTKKVMENKKIETEGKKIEKDAKESKKESAKKDTPKIDKDTEAKKPEGYKIKVDNEKAAAVAKETRVKPEPKKRETKEVKPAKIAKAEVPSKPPATKIVDKKQKSSIDKKDSVKTSPSTPKKMVNGVSTKVETTRPSRSVTKPSSKHLLSTMPAKSAKDANNRKVVEQKNIENATAASAAVPPAAAKLPAKQKTAERKPIGRRPKPISPIKARIPISPTKSTRSTPTTSVKSDKDGIIRRVKGDRGTTDSSTVSTPSGIEIDSMNKLAADKCLTEKSEDMSLDSIESRVLADLKEEREVVEEIEAVLQKAERIEGTRREDHLEGDDDVTAEATDKKEDDMTEDDVTADIEELPKKESSRKTSHELTEEDEYLIIEKEEIFIEDSVQSAEGEDKHATVVAESEKAKITKEEDDGVKAKEERPEDEEEEEEEEEAAEVSEEKEKADIPEKRLHPKEKDIEESKAEETLPSPTEALQEQMKGVIASATETVQKIEEKDDSGKKDSEDITKEPSSLSPDKFDSSEKKTTDTDVKPEIDQKDQQMPEKLEESHERISTLESGATTTAPTLPEDERITLDEIKEVTDEKAVVDVEKKAESTIQIQESAAPQVPIAPKQDAKPFEVHPPPHSMQREIVKTPDEVADLPVHEEVDPTLYRMEHFEKVKEEKPTPPTVQQREVKEPEAPPVKEQKGVFSFFGKVADKFEKGIDKLTGKSRRDSEKDIDEKSSSKSGSPKETKSQNIIFPVGAPTEEVSPVVAKLDKAREIPEAFEKGEPIISEIKVAAIKDTAMFLKEEIDDLKKTSEEISDKLPAADVKKVVEADTEVERTPEPIFEKCIVPDDKNKLDGIMSELEAEEDVEDVQALLEEASKKFKTVKDSLHDSLESLEEKIAEQEMVRVELEAASKDFVKDTLNEVVGKLEDMKPQVDDVPAESEELEKVVPEDFDDEKQKVSPTVTKDLKEAVRDVGEVLAGSAGILIDEKPKDVVEIVKKVAEVLKKDDFLSPDVLFEKEASKVEERKEEADDKSKTLMEAVMMPKKVGVTEELPPQEEIEEILVSPEEAAPSVATHEPTAKLDLHKDVEIKATKTPSPVKDAVIDKAEAMEICADLMKAGPVSASPKTSEDDVSAKGDVMEAGIESICVKERVEPPTRIADAEEEVKESSISFDRKVSPATAEFVMVTPDVSPTSPKLPSDKMQEKETEAPAKITDDTRLLPTDVLSALKTDESLEKIVEELAFTKKIKITMEIIEYIIIIRKIPREKVIWIIEQVIIKNGAPAENVVADLDLLRLGEVPTEKRHEIERCIKDEYITKNKKITMNIVHDLSMQKLITRRILIEIIIEYIVKNNIPREKILDISEKELSQLDLLEESTPAEDATSKQPESPTSKDDEKQEIAAAEPSKYTEIKKFVMDELIAKGQRITPQLIDDVCVAKLIPRRSFVNVIEEIIVEHGIPRSTIFDISEKELSELLTSEKEDEAVYEKEPTKDDVDELRLITLEKQREIVTYVSNEFIKKRSKITSPAFQEICRRYDISEQIFLEIIDATVDEHQLNRASILDISDNELTELLAVEKEESVAEGADIDADVQREKADDVKAKSIIPEKQEIESAIVEEFVVKKRRITPYIFEDICIRYKVSRRIILEIIEEIIVKRNVQRNTILDITDTELAELLAVVEAQDEDDGVINVESAVEEISQDDVEEDKLVDGFVSIPSKESEKDVDDFEAVEQEYKIRDVTVTPDKPDAETTPSEEKIAIASKDTIEDSVKGVAKPKEETIESAPTSEAAAVDQKSEDTSERSEIVDTTEKYLVEAQEKAEVKMSHPVQPLVLSDADKKVAKESPEESADKISPAVSDQESIVSQAVQASPEQEAKLAEIPPTPEKMMISPREPDADSQIADAPTGKLGPSDVVKEQVQSKEIESTQKSPTIEHSDDEAKSPEAVSAVRAYDEIARKIESTSPKDEKMVEDAIPTEETAPAAGGVRRMVVTASSEDGGHETEVCSAESIEITPEDSLKDSPIKTTPDQDSLRMDKESLHSGISSPERDSISEKSVTGPKDGDKVTPEDSLDKSPSGARDSQDLEDSLDKSDLIKPKEMETPKPLGEDGETSRKSSKTVEEIVDQLPEMIKPTESAKEIDTKTAAPTVSKDVSPADSSADLSVKLKDPVPAEDSQPEESPVESIADKSKPIEKSIADPGMAETVVQEVPEETHLPKVSKPLSDLEKSEIKIGDTALAPAIISDKTDDKMHVPITTDELKQQLDSRQSTPSSKKSSIGEEKLIEDVARSSISGPITAKKTSVETIDDHAATAFDVSGIEQVEKTDIHEKSSSVASEAPSPVKHDYPTLLDQSDRSSISDAKEIDKSISQTRSPSPSGRSKRSSVFYDSAPGAECDFKATSPTSEDRKEEIPLEEVKPSGAASPDSQRTTSPVSPVTKSIDTVESKVVETRLSEQQHDEKEVDEKDSSYPDISPSTDKQKSEPEAVSVASTKEAILDESTKKEEPSSLRSSSISSDTPQILDEKVQIVTELTDKSRSPSIIEEKDDDKPSEQSSLVGLQEKRDSHVDEHQDQDKVHDQSKLLSPTIESDDSAPKKVDDGKADEKDAGETVIVDRSKSPSIDASTAKDDKVVVAREPSKSPSTGDATVIADELTTALSDKRDTTDAAAESVGLVKTPKSPTDKSPILVEKQEDVTTKDHPRSPSIADEKEPITPADLSSTSPAKSDQKEPTDVPKSLTVDRSDVPSFVTEKQEEIESIDRSKSLGIATEKQDVEQPSDRARTPSITSDKPSDKEALGTSASDAIPAAADEEPSSSRSRSSSIDAKAPEKPVDGSRSPGIVADAETDIKLVEPDKSPEKRDEKESIDRSTSSSVEAEKPDGPEQSDRSQRSSIVSATQDGRDLLDRSRSPSIIGDKKDDMKLIEKSRSPSPVIIEQSEKDTIAQKEQIDESKKPSVVSELQDKKELTDRISLPSAVDDKQGETMSIERSQSLSPVAGKQSEKELIDRSKSPSISGDKQDEKEGIYGSRSPSVMSGTHDEKDSIDRSRSPSVIGDKHDDTKVSERSGSHSPVTEKPDDKESIDRSRSPSVAVEKQDGEEKIDDSKSPGAVSESHDEKHPIDRSRTSSIVSEAQGRSRSPSIVGDKQDEMTLIKHAEPVSPKAEKHADTVSTDRSRSPSVVAEKKEDEEKGDGAKSPSVVSGVDELKEPIDRSQASSIVSEAQDQMEAIDRSRSPSVARDAQDGTKLVGRSGSHSPVGKQDEKDTSDRSASPTLAVDKHDGKEPTDRSRTSSIVSGAQDEKEPLDRSRSPSVALEAQDGTKSVERSGSHSPVGKQDEKESSDRSASPTVAVDKQDGKEPTDRSQTSSIVSGAQDEKEPLDRSRSSSVALEAQDGTKSVERSGSHSPVGKQDEKESSDRSASPTVAVDKQDGKEPTDRSRTSSIVSGAQDEKEPLDRSRSPSVALEAQDGTKSVERSGSHSPVGKQDEKESSDRSASPTVAVDKQDGKEPTDRSRTSSIVSGAQDEKEPLDRSRSPSVALEAQDGTKSVGRSGSHSPVGKQDEKESSDRSASPTVAADKQDSKEPTDRSRTSSIVSGAQDEKEPLDRSRSPSVALEAQDGTKSVERSGSHSPVGKQDEKESSDRSASPTVAVDKQDGKEPTDRSRTSSIVSGAQDEKEPLDRSRSPSVALEAQDGTKSVERSGSHSPVGKQDEKESSDRSASPTVAVDKQDGKEPTDRSRTSSIVSGAQDEKEPLDRSRSPSVALEAQDGTKSVGRSGSHSPVGKQDEKESSDRSASPTVAADKQDSKEPTDRSRTSSIVSGAQDEKEPLDRSRSPSIVVDKQDETKLVGRSGSHSPVGKQDEKESSDRSGSPTVAADKQDGKEPIDRSRTSSIVSGAQDEKEPLDRSRSPSVALEAQDGTKSVERSGSHSPVGKQDEKEARDRSASPTVAVDKQDGKEPTDRSRTSSIVSGAQDEKEPLDRSRSPSVALEAQDGTKSVERSGSHSPVGKQDEKESSDRSASPTVAVDKHDGKEPTDRSRTSSIVPGAQDEKEPLDRSRSPSIVVDKQDETKPVEHSGSVSPKSEMQAEKESSDRSRSSSIAADKRDGKELIDGSTSPDVVSGAHDKKESLDGSRSPSIVPDQQDDTKLTEHSGSVSPSIEKQSEKVSIDRSRSPSIAVERQEEKETIPRSETSSVVSGVHDERETAQRSRSPSVVSDKPDDTKLTEQSDARSPVTDKHDAKEQVYRSRTPSVVAEKQDEEERIDRSRTSSIATEAHEEKDQIDRPRAISVVSGSDEKELKDRSRSPSLIGDKEDDSKVVERPGSLSPVAAEQDAKVEKQEPKDKLDPSEVITAQDKKEVADRSRSPSIVGDKPDETKSAERSGSLSPRIEKLDEKESKDRSRTPSVAAEQDGEEKMDGSRSPSVISEARDEKELTDRSPSVASDPKSVSRSPSVATDKLEEKDRSRSPSISGDKPDETKFVERPGSLSPRIEKLDVKEPSDRSRSPSDAADKPDVKEAVDRSESLSVASGAQDEKETLDRSRSPSIIGDKQDETKHSRSPSIATEKQDEKEEIDRSKRSSIVSDERDEKASTDRSRSSSIVGEKLDETKSTDGSVSPSDATKKPEEKEVLVHGESSIVGDKKDESKLIERSKSPSAAAEDQTEKPLIDRSKSPSVAGEEQDEKNLTDASKTPSTTALSPDEKKSIDRSRSPSIAGEKQEKDEPVDEPKVTCTGVDASGAKTAMDRRESSSIDAEKQEPAKSVDPSQSPSVSVAKEDEKESVDHPESPRTTFEIKDTKESSDDSKPSGVSADSITTATEKPVEKETSFSSAVERPSVMEPIVHSGSITAEKHETEPKDRTKLVDTKAEMLDDKLSKSKDTSVVEMKDTKESIDHPSSVAVVPEKHDEKDSAIDSRSRSITPEKQDGPDMSDRSKSPGSAEKQEDTASTDRSPSPTIVSDQRDEKAKIDDVTPSSTAVIKDDDKKIESSRPTTVPLTDHEQDENLEKARPESPKTDADKLHRPEPVSDHKAAGDDSKEKEIEKTTDGSRSPSIDSKRDDDKDASTLSSSVSGLDKPSSPGVLTAGEKAPVDHSETLSIATEKVDSLQPTDRSKSPSVTPEKEDKSELRDGSRASSPGTEKQTESQAKSSKMSITDEADVKAQIDRSLPAQADQEPLDRSRKSSVAVEKQHPEEQPIDSTDSTDAKPLDSKKPFEKMEAVTIEKVSEPVEEKTLEKIEMKTSPAETTTDVPESTKPSSLSPITDRKISDEDKSKTARISEAQIHEKSGDIRKDSVAGIVTGQESRLDGTDAVQALQKLAETIADKSDESKYDKKPQAADGTVKHDGTASKDRSRSHSLFEADERTPLSRSRTASLFEDKVPEVCSTLVEGISSYREPEHHSRDEKDQESIEETCKLEKASVTGSIDEKIDSVSSDARKHSGEKIEVSLSKRSSVGAAEEMPEKLVEDAATKKLAEVESYIRDKYIAKKQKITLQIVDEIVTLYSISRNIILELIEAIIVEKKVPREFVVSFPEDAEKKSVSKHVSDDYDVTDVIDAAKRCEIESYIHEEFVKKNKTISSNVIDEIAAAKRVSRHIIIMIVEEMVHEQKGLTAKFVQDDIPHEPRSEPASIDEKYAEESDLLDDSISDEKRREVENYIMDECVKKRIRINVLVLEQIISRVRIPRLVLLRLIEYIIVTRKISRTEMIDDVINDEIATAKLPERRFSKEMVGPGVERLSEKEQLDGDVSGESTSDPRAYEHSTLESRRYDDEFRKQMSAYANDYESPFHKAFVGGMTEMRTTHITTLSGKSTPEYNVRDETPELASESQTKSTEATSQVPAIDAADVRTIIVTTSSVTVDASTSLPETTISKDKVTTREVISDGKKIVRDVDTSEADKIHVTSDITKITSREIHEEAEPEMHTTRTRTVVVEETEPVIVRKIIREVEEEEPEIVVRKIVRKVEEQEPEIIVRKIVREVEEEEPEIIVRKIVREVEEEEPEIIVRKIVREVEEEEPEIIVKVKQRVITDEKDETADDYEISKVTHVSEESAPEIVKTITTKRIKTIVTEDVPQDDDTKIKEMTEEIISKLRSADATQGVESIEEHGGVDVKRIITTVTTVTDSDQRVGTQKAPTVDAQQGDKQKADPTETAGVTATAKSIVSSISHEEKSKVVSKAEKIVLEETEPPMSPVIKDLISDQRSLSGKVSPDIQATKEAQHGPAIGKSTPEVPSSPFFRDSAVGHSQISGRSTPDKRPTSRSSTATPEGLRSNEIIRTTITTTRTMSEEGDIITTTMEITETTNEKGETIILAEKTDVKVEDRILPSDMDKSTYGGQIEGPRVPTDLASEADIDPASPRSDHSSLQSRAGTQAWGSSEERPGYSDDDVPGSPLSTTSQVGYSPQSTYHFGDHSFDKGSSHKSMEFSEADMSSSFYGELPDLPPRVTTMKAAYADSTEASAAGSASTDGDFSFKKLVADKESAGASSDKKATGMRYIDEADVDFEKALTERRETKKEATEPSRQVDDRKAQDAVEKKDPLAGWDSPLGLPSPKPPRKFNLRTPARPNDSAEISLNSINVDPINDWGEPLRLPSPSVGADDASNKGAPSTPKKERKQPKKVISENIKNRKRSESPAKTEKKSKDAKGKVQPVYMDLTYVPHHGNSYYTSVEFFKRVRARYYVFSGTEPSREVYDALLDAKKTWEDKDLEVTMIPTYDTDTLGYWVADNEEALAANHIDLSPSASRCTINLQDHETSCSAYRLEF